MADRKKPGKNSSRLGEKKRVPTPDWVNRDAGLNGLPSPFLQAGLDVGIDFSVPHGQNSHDNSAQSTAGNAPDQAAVAATAAASVAASTKKAPASKKSIVSASKKKAKAPKAGPTTPKKPAQRKTSMPAKVTPSKRTHEVIFPDLSYYSSNSKKNDEDVGVEPDSDSAPCKADGRSDYTEHSSDNEDDFIKNEREFGFRNEIDDEDEYTKYYDGDDHYVKKPRC
ncbi:hypothetical protein VP1G_03152 [Cytospora mali]|uniref:Uncharacterized protein n=1 Tax=Cytospora mali TaxID=578113 RepID=A0A194UVS3_CYTMA|nr:hypothetical protein VP1G_03152 [Valsa mali var. pyri (nom. inval.)]